MKVYKYILFNNQNVKCYETYSLYSFNFLDKKLIKAIEKTIKGDK